jgi:diamine N-acetyltransferase
MTHLKLQNIFDIKNEQDIDHLLQLVDNSLHERLKDDFAKGYFKGFFVIKPNVMPNSDNFSPESILSFVLYYDSYSTWQSRVLYVSEIWLESSLSNEIKFEILKLISEKLFTAARANNSQRINLNLRHSDENKILCDSLIRLGAIHLTKSEDWLIFELGEEEMKQFIENVKSRESVDSQFKIVKVNDIRKYGPQIRNLIRDLAIFEKMEDQFQLDINNFLNDYEHQEHLSFSNQKFSSRFYEAIVVLKSNDIEEVVVGFAIYYKNYELKRGRGMYLEDLFIKEEYRGRGLGTALWSRVIEDSLRNFDTKFMQWSVLGWNKSAINFYLKYKSKNLTEIDNLNLYRYVTEKIYSKF